MLARQLQQPVREIVYRTREDTHGPIARLVSPSDLGELIKPFVLLDRFDFDARAAPMEMELGWHPHSGIATVTVVLESGRVKGFQLWVALPPELENAANASRYVMPKDVPDEGPVRLILGAYGNAKSPIAAPPMSYLAVSLRAGERWTYHPPRGHTVAWVAVHEGVLRTSSPIPSGEIAIFEPSGESIDFIAEGNTGFVLGSAAKHPHDLVLGNYSVHTSAEALREGEAEIRRIGQKLRADGTLGR